LFVKDSMSEGIVFCRSSEEEEDSSSSSPAELSTNVKSASSSSSGAAASKSTADQEAAAAGTNQQARRTIQINTLYIQMEFCEKKTLRDSIDSGLYKETSKVWRMFRLAVRYRYRVPVVLWPDLVHN
jgi:hypothetical protein